jgi:hypothetical protein
MRRILPDPQRLGEMSGRRVILRQKGIELVEPELHVGIAREAVPLALQCDELEVLARLGQRIGHELGLLVGHALVIVAVEMLTGRIGIGNFLWNEYNNGLYTSIILSILTIGVVGFLLDRAMSLLEQRFKSI